MERIIEPDKEAIKEIFCDLCKDLILITGLPQDKIPKFDKQISLVMTGNFGHVSKLNGLFFNAHYCNECAEVIVEKLETLSGRSFETPLIDGE